MVARGGELIATNEPAIVSKPPLDAIVVEDGKSDRCLPDPSWTDESEWGEVLGEVDDLLNQIVASKTGPRTRGRGLSTCAGFQLKALYPSTV